MPTHPSRNRRPKPTEAEKRAERKRIVEGLLNRIRHAADMLDEAPDELDFSRIMKHFEIAKRALHALPLPETEWTPFLDDGSLPLCWRDVPFLASRHSLEETARILKVRKNTSKFANLRRYWEWFSAGRRLIRSPIE
jgi:hypothetical protein